MDGTGIEVGLEGAIVVGKFRLAFSLVEVQLEVVEMTIGSSELGWSWTC